MQTYLYFTSSKREQSKNRKSRTAIQHEQVCKMINEKMINMTNSKMTHTSHCRYSRKSQGIL
ncbi:hypothetical protein ENHY17A_50254 [Moraxellaceae bacterium 17A]|nr:hypothetical protein ENHY17A_50254 [Moraxellaceae bacterium 17A]